MNITIKGALIGAIIPTLGSFAIFFLGNFQTEEKIEKKFVGVLSESFDCVDTDMSFQQSTESINEYIRVLEEENINLKNTIDENDKLLLNEKDKEISIFHLKELLSENVGLYTDSHLTDNLGNVYSNGMGFYTNGYVEYTNLDIYTNLTGTLVISEGGKNNDFEGIFCIYDLDSMEKIYDDVIIARGMEPYFIDCDLTNVKKIKISFSITNNYDKYVVYFVEPKLK